MLGADVLEDGSVSGGEVKIRIVVSGDEVAYITRQRSQRQHTYWIRSAPDFFALTLILNRHATVFDFAVVELEMIEGRINLRIF